MARCGLAAGTELARPLLREVRRELRLAEALATAGRALERRDLSRRGLDERLRARGVAPDARREALVALEGAGYVDDARLARARAESLAGRGFADRAVEARLLADGLAPELVRATLAMLPPEGERARALAASAPDARRAWSLLARRGFDPDTIEEAVPALDAEVGGGLG